MIFLYQVESLHVEFFCEDCTIYCYHTISHCIVRDSLINQSEINETIAHAKIGRFRVFSSEFLIKGLAFKRMKNYILTIKSINNFYKQYFLPK